MIEYIIYDVTEDFGMLLVSFFDAYNDIFNICRQSIFELYSVHIKLSIPKFVEISYNLSNQNEAFKLKL